MSARIRAARERRGWSQQQLAAAAGVTRQLVTAVEAARHTPNVGAALALARALDESVEALFGPPAHSPDSAGRAWAIPAEASDHGPVRLARVGGREVAVAHHHGVDAAESWAASDAYHRNGEFVVYRDAETATFVVAGCDPALGLLAALTERRSRGAVVAAHATTGDAIDALAAGTIHAAIVHGPSLDDMAIGARIERIHIARWAVGIASSRRAGAPTISEIAERRLRVVQRAEGAGTQRAFTRALERAGVHATSIAGPVAHGHLDVARRVAAGAAAGITMEASARSYGLTFAPIETHRVELWIAQGWVDLPEARAMLETLGSAALRARLDDLGGYDLEGCGTAARAS